MTVQAKAFHCSVLIHALLFLGVFILSRNISTQVKTVLIDFSLACGSGGAGPQGPSLLRSSGSNGEQSAVSRSQRRDDRGQKTEKSRKTAVPKARVKPRQKPISDKLMAKNPSRPKASVPISKLEAKPASEPEVKSAVATALEETKAESNDEVSALDKHSEKEAATQAALGAIHTETDEEYGSAGNVHGLPAGSAKGSGSGAGLHGGGTAKGKYLREHFGYIRTIIMSKLRYPSIARRKGWSGKLKISFLVGEDGSVNDIKIISSSGFSILDKNAIDTVKEIAPLPSPPVRAEIIMPITYRLE